MLNIGQRVVVVKSDKVKKGSTGQVIVIDDDKEKHTIGVFFTKELDNGHDLDGNCPEGFGRWFAEEQLLALRD